MSSCSSLLAVGYQNRLCLLTNQWISQTNSNTFLISWSGTLPSDITALLALPICPSQQSSQVLIHVINLYNYIIHLTINPSVTTKL